MLLQEPTKNITKHNIIRRKERMDLNLVKGKTFLVTGAAGFIGSHIVEFLLKHKADKVIGLDNFLTGNIENIKLFETASNFEFLESDIKDYKACLEGTKNIDFISHQAALGSVPRSIEFPLDTHANNATGFINVLHAAKENKVKKIVYASSSSVYGDNQELVKVEDNLGQPLSPYAVSKYVNEKYAAIFNRTYDLQIVGLRYFNIFGPRQNPNGAYAAAIPQFITKLLNGEDVFINGDGSQSRDFTYVRNAVQANIKALFNSKFTSHEAMNIACGKSYSVLDMYNRIKLELNVSAEAKHRGERFGDVKNSLADINKALQLIDYKPEITFEQGLQETIVWFKNQYESQRDKQEMKG
jgi:UDP-N-acetylglucosamine/UDP-N-acetylgalactosamine 4-epimerase